MPGANSLKYGCLHSFVSTLFSFKLLFFQFRFKCPVGARIRVLFSTLSSPFFKPITQDWLKSSDPIPPLPPFLNSSLSSAQALPQLPWTLACVVLPRTFFFLLLWLLLSGIFSNTPQCLILWSSQVNLLILMMLIGHLFSPVTLWIHSFALFPYIIFFVSHPNFENS